MESKEIIGLIIEKNNQNVLNDKIEIQQRESEDSVELEFGFFPHQTFIVKEYETQFKDDLETRCYDRILEYIIEKSISTR